MKSQSKSARPDINLTKEQLGKRLKNYEIAETASRPKSQDDSECDAILVSKIAIGRDEKMKSDAQISLEHALQEELYIEHDTGQGEPAICNKNGLALVQLPSCVHLLEPKVHALETAGAVKNKNIAFLQNRVGSLTNSLQGYKMVRSRFICTYKRQESGIASIEDKKTIRIGNMWAHGGMQW